MRAAGRKLGVVDLETGEVISLRRGEVVSSGGSDWQALQSRKRDPLYGGEFVVIAMTVFRSLGARPVTLSARRVLDELLGSCDRNGCVQVTRHVLHVRTGVSRAQIYRAVSELMERGLIREVDVRGAPGFELSPVFFTRRSKAATENAERKWLRSVSKALERELFEESAA